VFSILDAKNFVQLALIPLNALSFRAQDPNYECRADDEAEAQQAERDYGVGEDHNRCL
jgi:hypothetical protein